jgi:hypothetical protein
MSAPTEAPTSTIPPVSKSQSRACAIEANVSSVARRNVVVTAEVVSTVICALWSARHDRRTGGAIPDDRLDDAVRAE